VIGDILQPTHLLFILVVALLVLGPKRLPEVGRSLGRGLRDVRNALSGEDHDEVPTDVGPLTAPPPAPPAPAAHDEPPAQTDHKEPAPHTTAADQADPAQQPEHVA
jgi:sec-independent protein translocase protein TatA